MHQVCRALLLFWAVPVTAQQPATPLEQHLRAAQRAQAAQDCHTAAREYGITVHLLPNSGELRSNYGVALYCDGQLPLAIAAFQRALVLNPALAAPHLFLGLSAYRLGDNTEAVQELQTMLRFSPSDKVAHLWLGYAYIAEAKSEQAIQQFEAVLQIDPKDIDAHYALGQSWLELGRQTAQRLEALAPNGPYIMQLVGEQHELMGDTAKAKAAFQEAAKRRSADGSGTEAETQQELLYNQARAAIAKAQAAFEAVVRDAPDSYRAHQILADIALSRDQQEDAISEYRKALAGNPDLPGIHESISNCLMRQAHFADALTELKAEKKIQPGSARVSMEMARIQLDQGEAQAAIASLHEALRLPNPPVEAYVLLGKATLRTGDTASAVSALETAIGKDTKLPLAYYLLAKAYRQSGNRAAMAKALQNYRRTSQDEQERQLAEGALQDPNSPPLVMQAQDMRDAKEMTSSGP